MGIDKVFIPLCLTIDEYNVLLQALEYFSYASTSFDCVENIEDCVAIRNKIMRYLEPKENFVEYLKSKREKKEEIED